MNLASILALLQLVASLLSNTATANNLQIQSLAQQAISLAEEALSQSSASVSPVATTVSTVPPASATASPAPASEAGSDPPQIAINPQTLVGILCYYNITYTDSENGAQASSSEQLEVRGSGVIINSAGDILTNRHLIEQPETQASVPGNSGNAIPVTTDYTLDHCDVGQLPASASLPTVAEIESINPYVQIPVLGYTAQPVFVSPTLGLSAAEVQDADFAILRITGVSASGPTFGVTSVPPSFPYARLLAIKPYPDLDGQVVTYGFPGDVTSGQGNFFQTLTMTGSVGSVTGIIDGDEFYAGTPLIVQTDLAIAHGRSGSPLFWRGYVIGIVTFFVGENQTDSGSVASDAILKGLAGTGYIGTDD